MAKLLLILIFGGALVSELVPSQAEPPLMIDSGLASSDTGD
jgi:hypothetical protein